MDSATEARLTRVRSMSRIANRVCIAAVALICVGAVLVGIGALVAPDKLTCDVNGVRARCSEMPGGALIFAFVAAGIGTALLLKGLYHLSRLFKNYSAGEIFTHGSVREIKRIGTTVFAYAVFQIGLLVAAA